MKRPMPAQPEPHSFPPLLPSSSPRTDCAGNFKPCSCLALVSLTLPQLTKYVSCIFGRSNLLGFWTIIFAVVYGGIISSKDLSLPFLGYDNTFFTSQKSPLPQAWASGSFHAHRWHQRSERCGPSDKNNHRSPSDKLSDEGADKS